LREYTHASHLTGDKGELLRTLWVSPLSFARRGSLALRWTITSAIGFIAGGGVGIDTVRYYERNGLLTPRTRLASGYRRYGELELAHPHAHSAG
jgi:hypothetical protein